MIDPASLPAPRVTANDLVAADNWHTRRKVLFVAMIFIAVLISYTVILGKDTAVNAQAVLALIASETSVLCAYVFGSVWDDHNKRMFFRGQCPPSGLPEAPPPDGACPPASET